MTLQIYDLIIVRSSASTQNHDFNNLNRYYFLIEPYEQLTLTSQNKGAQMKKKHGQNKIIEKKLEKKYIVCLFVSAYFDHTSSL